MIIRCIIA